MNKKINRGDLECLRYLLKNTLKEVEKVIEILDSSNNI